MCCSHAVCAPNQVTSDIPEHHFTKRRAPPPGAALSSPAGAMRTPRDVDATARGLGANKAVPVASCSEENLLMEVGLDINSCGELRCC